MKFYVYIISLVVKKPWPSGAQKQNKFEIWAQTLICDTRNVGKKKLGHFNLANKIRCIFYSDGAYANKTFHIEIVAQSYNISL